jgi:hypothetical protein
MSQEAIAVSVDASGKAMSAELLELVAATSQLSDFLFNINLGAALELRILGAPCGEQDRHRAIADEFAEAALGFEHTCA